MRKVIGLGLVVGLLSSAVGCGASYSPKRASEAGYAPPPAPSYAAATNTEDYRHYGTNPVVDPATDRFSTFAIDVDTASYALSRRMLLENELPPDAAVRVEEFVNSFDYGYPAPSGSEPFAVHLAAAPSPFDAGHHVLRVALQAKRVETKDRAPAHLVYLVDTSGSMQSPDKLELVKKSLRFLTDSLKPGDTVALCTYAGHVREVLGPTGIDKKDAILKAIDDLSANGSTAMSSGIQLAYDLASRTLVKGHTSRVIVLSDGDANVGPMSHEEILKTIEGYKKKGIYLSTIGFGRGNYKDTMMEQLADKGDGNYSYVDDERQAKKVFVEQANGLIDVVARDVKVQVELDPSVVKSYRLIGYENRDVADKDFRNDKVDGGEVGAGHSVTALYDVVLKPGAKGSLATVRVRHKSPTPSGAGADEARELTVKMEPSALYSSFDEAPESLRFASAVARFAEVLRKSPHAKSAELVSVEALARSTKGTSPERSELVSLVRRAAELSGVAQGPAVAK